MMRIQVVNFSLVEMSGKDHLSQVEAIAPAFAGLSGLISKTWLANSESNTYGVVYVWRDREAMEACKQTDFYNGMLANPHFENITSTDFGVLENSTLVTRGSVQVSAA